VPTQLDRLREVVAGRSSLAPVSSLFGLTLADVDHGDVTARMAAVPPSTMGGPGAVLVLADLALTSPIISTLPAEQQVSTLSLHYAGLGPLPGPGTALVARGSLVGVDTGSSAGVSAATISTEDGRLVAHATSRCAIYASRPGWNALGALSDVEPTGFAGLHLATRRVDGDSTVEITASDAHANRSGYLHGGVLAAVLAAAAADTLDAAAPRQAGAPLELDVTYLRSVATDGALLRATGRVDHAGSRFAAARAELRDARGRPAVIATASRWQG
jgi:uncharacterized protein (TIGR00369 family)